MEPADVPALVRRATGGDRAAWDAIVAEYGGLVRSVARGHRLSEAQTADAVQTTWLLLVEHLAAIREPERLAGWLRTTARRVSLAIVREAGREEPTDTCDRCSGTGSDEAAPEASAVRRDQQVLVRRAVATLPPRHRQLLVLLAASPPASYAQISAGLGIPVGSIGPTRARALARLRTALETAGLHDAALN
ncbi:MULTISPECIES: RNA polymerase sigma factor [unclassified Geodermatophilus]|uniref:RNA polymerase sigma factor n=1 Tax=unclassified Geodermatophilus TaxID=2637632 RepID=UPI003EE8341F